MRPHCTPERRTRRAERGERSSSLAAVGELAVVLFGVAIVVVTLAVSRRARERSRSGARTIDLRFDSTGVERRLGDGRSEGATWSELTEIELVHTPVATADGAREFVVLAESEEHGCLVPLGVGHDAQLLVELSRLPGFDLRTFEQVLATKKNGRQVIWTRQVPVDGTALDGDRTDGDRTDGTGSNS